MMLFLHVFIHRPRADFRPVDVARGIDRNALRNLLVTEFRIEFGVVGKRQLAEPPAPAAVSRAHTPEPMRLDADPADGSRSLKTLR